MSRFSVSSSGNAEPASRSSRRSGLASPAALAGALLVAASAILSQTTHATAPGLQQTVESIRQILAKDGLYERTTTTQRQDYKSVTERKYEVTEVDGCKLVVVSSGHSHADMLAQGRTSDRKWNDIFHPDFSLMDPSTVVVNDPEAPQPQWQVKGYLVRISIEMGKPLMVASTVDLATNTVRDLPGLPAFSVFVSSREAADKLAKDFAQMATACRAN